MKYEKSKESGLQYRIEKAKVSIYFEKIEDWNSIENSINADRSQIVSKKSKVSKFFQKASNTIIEYFCKIVKIIYKNRSRPENIEWH